MQVDNLPIQTIIFQIWGVIWLNLDTCCFILISVCCACVYAYVFTHIHVYTRGFLPSAPPGDCLVSRTTERYKIYSFILLSQFYTALFNFLFLIIQMITNKLLTLVFIYLCIMYSAFLPPFAYAWRKEGKVSLTEV